MDIRASIGTAIVLGLEKAISEAPTTTAYLMMYYDGHCLANCSFCPQAKDSSSNINKLSRVLWPKYQLSDIITKLKSVEKKIKRICLQTIQFPDSDILLLAILKELKNNQIKIPISVCSYPTNKKMFRKMKDLDVKRMGISFDCATPELFDKVKGSKRGRRLTWELLEKATQDACEVFGNQFVSTHLIIGLGETERESLNFIQQFYDRKITIGLFAFTPVKGTELEKHPQPNIESYRRIQLGKYLIKKQKTSFSQMKFGENKEIIDFGVKREILIEAIKSGKPFETSGCPFCNRPFYNESPGKELYNYPRELSEIEINEIMTKF
ncbi:MAG: radical SAM protein [Asgard group archaeon]|nr:radical SAM protein [Asgard group archaeon]